jgi:serine/threonine-protein kinase
MVLHPLNRCQLSSPTNRHNQGFSNQQVLMLLLVVFPLGLIGLGLILNVAMKRDQAPEVKAPQASETVAPKPTTTQAPNAPETTQTQKGATTTAQQSLTGTVELGASVSGARIRLLMGSINQRDAQFREFTYQLGNETVQAMANCPDQSWTSYPERQVNRPQSPATERMLSLVCGNAPMANQPAPAAPATSPDLAYPGVAIVFDPPSNVRSTPGGTFLCTVNNQRSIRVGQAQGEWYPTSACGSKGFIHRSQVRF